MNYLTTKQVAEILNVSQSRVRQLIIEDRLISTKIGRDNLINQDDLDKYLKYEKKSIGRPKKHLR